MLGQSDSLSFGFHNPLMHNQVSGIELDLDFVLRLTHFDTPPDPGSGHGVAIGVQGNIAFNIHQALMQPVHFRNPGGQWL